MKLPLTAQSLSLAPALVSSRAPIIAAALTCSLLPSIWASKGAVSPRAPVAAAPPPMFLPGPDTKTERVYTWTQTSDTKSIEILLDGEATAEVPTARTRKESEQSVTLTDSFTRSDVNRPLELTRSFDEFYYEASGELTLELGDGANAKLEIGCDGDSELDGVAVEFLWNDDEEEYGVKYADDYSGQEELLEPLVPDADFIALLPSPDEDLESGATWEIEPSDLQYALLPGGALPMIRESEMQAIEGVVDPMLLPGVLDTLAGDAAGEVIAKLESIADGTATIAITVDAEFRSDQADAIEDFVIAAAPEGMNLEIETAQFTGGLKGKGVLVWDTERHIALSFRLDLKTTLDVEIALQLDGVGVSAPFELAEVREGTLRVDMTAAE